MCGKLKLFCFDKVNSRLMLHVLYRVGVRVALMIGMNKVLYVNGFYLFVLYVYSGKRTD